MTSRIGHLPILATFLFLARVLCGCGGPGEAANIDGAPVLASATPYTSGTGQTYQAGGVVPAPSPGATLQALPPMAIRFINLSAHVPAPDWEICRQKVQWQLDTDFNPRWKCGGSLVAFDGPLDLTVPTVVSDALAPTFGATVVGGGAVVIPVFYDGSNWKVG